ncbi:unnamed protein product [Rotaria magnacalcarata]|uniref:Uncharacterized protein n=1 Tax=Rotaria magnacalcarata TaxID=392030 RepID=A0A816YD45_9BILA|nr:unnamed protein product [Rotaria magnacalcarata]
MLDRLVPDIERNRQQILIDSSSPQNNNDIMFNKIYRDLQYKYSLTPFVSLLLHLDGIALSRSSKLNLWLFSCTIIELPVELRYRCCNTVVLSVWVGYREPIIDAWLSESLQQLNTLLHGPRKLGSDTEHVANQLISIYYKDHPLFYKKIQNYVLHLHCHLADQYYLHGSLSNLGVFGQESFLGYLSRGRSGTRNLGQIIVNNYHVDFTLCNQSQQISNNQSKEIDGLFDPVNISITALFTILIKLHVTILTSIGAF